MLHPIARWVDESGSNQPRSSLSNVLLFCLLAESQNRTGQMVYLRSSQSFRWVNHRREIFEEQHCAGRSNSDPGTKGEQLLSDDTEARCQPSCCRIQSVVLIFMPLATCGVGIPLQKSSFNTAQVGSNIPNVNFCVVMKPPVIWCLAKEV